MATLSIDNPTLLDVAKRTDPNGKIAVIVELLNQTNPIVGDMTLLEANQEMGHKSVIRVGIPLPTWRKAYQGVQPTKSETAQVVDSIGTMEAYAEVDKAVADLNGNKAAFRLSEERAHIEGMNQEMARTIIYGNEGTDPAKFTGLAARYNDLLVPSGQNIVSAGGTGNDNTSIWLVVWGPNTIHGIYPKGQKSGLEHEDKGQETVPAATGGLMEAYRSHYKWSAGLVVRDWRYAVRIANIDVPALSDPATAKDASQALIRQMIMASERIPHLGAGRASWYVNRTIRENLRLGILDRTANNLNWETVAGKKVMTFDDIPVQRLDVLLNTEAAVA